MSQRMDTAATTGAFTLGGVALGGGLDWIRSSLASKRAEVGRRDELIAALDTACISLLIEIRSWRTLDTSSSKFRQVAFGMLETGLPELPASGAAALSVSDFGYLLARWIGMSAAKRLQHQTPVALVDTLRRAVMPLLSEVAVIGVRLSMTGDEAIKAATVRVTDAAGALLEHVDERPTDYVKREEELRAAVGQLRRARDAAAARRWRRKKLQGRISTG
jgi:hypothetical protein